MRSAYVRIRNSTLTGGLQEIRRKGDLESKVLNVAVMSMTAEHPRTFKVEKRKTKGLMQRDAGPGVNCQKRRAIPFLPPFFLQAKSKPPHSSSGQMTLHVLTADRLHFAVSVWCHLFVLIMCLISWSAVLLCFCLSRLFGASRRVHMMPWLRVFVFDPLSSVAVTSNLSRSELPFSLIFQNHKEFPSILLNDLNPVYFRVIEAVPFSIKDALSFKEKQKTAQLDISVTIVSEKSLQHYEHHGPIHMAKVDILLPVKAWSCWTETGMCMILPMPRYCTEDLSVEVPCLPLLQLGIWTTGIQHIIFI